VTGFRVRFFDGASSKAVEATVTYSRFFLYVRNDDISLAKQYDLKLCHIEPRLGTTSRTIRFAGGAMCETDDFAAVEALERATRQNPGMRLVDVLERRWRTVLLSLAGIVLCTWAFIEWGIPVVAASVAKTIPPPVVEAISAKTLATLDSRLLKPSALDEETTERLNNLFRGLAEEAGGGYYDYRLVLRASPAIGPNAFALPDGQIVMTDELVELAGDDAEIEGVLLHEIGHVVHQHGMRLVLQNAGVFLLISAIVGDVTSITSAAASLPTILTQSGYSRDLEREADRFAAAQMNRLGMGTKPLRTMLERLSDIHDELPAESVYSSHPVIRERLQYLEELDAEAGGEQ
jgi:Zn-dependent protease with chaperone function